VRGKEKHCPCKPGSVLTECQCLSFIYYACRHASLAFYPPSHLRLGGLPSFRTKAETMVYMNLQPPDGTARRSPDGWWSLTPPSHPCPTRSVLLAEPKKALLGRSFSSSISSCRQLLLLSEVECPVLPGLSSRLSFQKGQRQAGAVLRLAKVRISGQKAKFYLN